MDIAEQKITQGIGYFGLGIIYYSFALVVLMVIIFVGFSIGLVIEAVGTI